MRTNWLCYLIKYGSTSEYCHKYRSIYCFYQGGSIVNCTHVTGPFDQSSAESEYNAAFNYLVALTQFSVIINESLNNDPDVVP